MTALSAALTAQATKKKIAVAGPYFQSILPTCHVIKANDQLKLFTKRERDAADKKVHKCV